MPASSWYSSMCIKSLPCKIVHKILLLIVYTVSGFLYLHSARSSSPRHRMCVCSNPTRPYKTEMLEHTCTLHIHFYIQSSYVHADNNKNRHHLCPSQHCPCSWTLLEQNFGVATRADIRTCIHNKWEEWFEQVSKPCHPRILMSKATCSYYSKIR